MSNREVRCCVIKTRTWFTIVWGDVGQWTCDDVSVFREEGAVLRH